MTAAQRLEDVVNPFFNKLIAVIKQSNDCAYYSVSCEIRIT